MLSPNGSVYGGEDQHKSRLSEKNRWSANMAALFRCQRKISFMETGILSPKALFQKDIRYTIPAFQRRYVWTLEDQWEPLWEDVRNTAEDYLEKLEAHGGEFVAAERNTKKTLSGGRCHSAGQHGHEGYRTA